MTMDNQTIIQLVEKSQQGDSAAFARLYELLYKDLYKAAYYMLGNVHDAENAVSETVLDAFAGIGKLRDALAFRGWIFAILSNKCKAIMREYVKNREHLSSSPPEDYEQLLGKEDPEIARAEDTSTLQKAFAVLSQEEKQIVTMTVYGQLDSNEIAARLSLNRNTVRSKYSRALQKMKACL